MNKQNELIEFLGGINGVKNADEALLLAVIAIGRAWDCAGTANLQRSAAHACPG